MYASSSSSFFVVTDVLVVFPEPFVFASRSKVVKVFRCWIQCTFTLYLLALGVESHVGAALTVIRHKATNSPKMMMHEVFILKSKKDLSSYLDYQKTLMPDNCDRCHFIVPKYGKKFSDTVGVV